MEAIACPQWQQMAGRRQWGSAQCRSGPSSSQPSGAECTAGKWEAELSFTRKTKPQGRQWTPAVPPLLGHMYIWALWAQLQPISQADPPTAFHKRLLTQSRWRSLNQDGGCPGGWCWENIRCSMQMSSSHRPPIPCKETPCFPQRLSLHPNNVFKYYSWNTWWTNTNIFFNYSTYMHFVMYIKNNHNFYIYYIIYIFLYIPWTVLTYD